MIEIYVILLTNIIQNSSVTLSELLILTILRTYQNVIAGKFD